MKYFLTGATGFVGGRTAEILRKAGHQVSAVVRTPASAESLVKLGVEIHQGDVTEKETMRRPMMDADGVFHFAGWYKIGVKDKSPGYRVNVDGTRNVLELMKELEIPRGVYTSTLAVNSDTHGKLVDESYQYTGDHLSVYDETKAAAHDIADEMIAQGLPLVILMPGLIYGPGDTSQMGNALRDYLQGKLPMIPRETAYCWAHVDDVARVHITAMEKAAPGGTYIVGGPPHKFTEAIDIAHELTGKRKPLVVPAGLFKVMAVFMGAVEKIITPPPVYSSEALQVIAGVTYLGDNSKAKKELGYSPRPLREGFKETLNYELKHLGLS